jgi:hypothetical protein
MEINLNRYFFEFFLPQMSGSFVYCTELWNPSPLFFFEEKPSPHYIAMYYTS